MDNLSSNKEKLQINQPAFVNKNLKRANDGMLLLDFFAAKAMESLIKKNHQSVAESAYKIAFEMIKERTKYFNPDDEYFF